MRYADGGGLTTEGRSRRELVRLQAAEMFEHDTDARQVAGRCGSARSRSTSGGVPGGPAAKRRWPRRRRGNPCKLDEEQIAQLRAALEAGPAAYGWEMDQRWTLARAAALVMRLFGVSYTLRGVSFLLHRLGFSPQVPVHRAFERDEDAVAAWRSATWAKVRGSRR